MKKLNNIPNSIRGARWLTQIILVLRNILVMSWKSSDFTIRSRHSRYHQIIPLVSTWSTIDYTTGYVNPYRDVLVPSARQPRDVCNWSVMDAKRKQEEKATGSSLWLIGIISGPFHCRSVDRRFRITETKPALARTTLCSKGRALLSRWNCRLCRNIARKLFCSFPPYFGDAWY